MKGQTTGTTVLKAIIVSVIVQNSEVLPNPYGTAPGLFSKRRRNFSNASDLLVRCTQCLPMKLFDCKKENIFPKLTVIQLRTAGIGESALAEKIQPILNGIDGLIVGYCVMLKWSIYDYS